MGSFGDGLSFYVESVQRVMTIKKCKKFYNKAKNKRPGRPERDYFKIVLLSIPPFDYQYENVLDLAIDECDTIEELSELIASSSKKDSFLWESRKRNMKWGFGDTASNRNFYSNFWR